MGKNDKLFSIEEVERATHKMPRKKAPGPDGLTIEVIEEVFLANKILFTKLLNQCLKKGYFPKDWKTAQLVLFNKEGKDDSEPSSYRPICLLNAWSKVLDKILAQRLLPTQQ